MMAADESRQMAALVAEAARALAEEIERVRIKVSGLEEYPGLDSGQLWKIRESVRALEVARDLARSVAHDCHVDYLPAAG